MGRERTREMVETRTPALSPFVGQLCASAFSASFAEFCTIPLDTAKVRLQIQKTPEGQKPRYSGLIGTAKTVAAEEGVQALFGGLSAGLQRQVVFAGLRIGMYVPIRDAITGKLPEGQAPTLIQKIMAGIATGAIAISVANPTDLVKIKMQA